MAIIAQASAAAQVSAVAGGVFVAIAGEPGAGSQLNLLAPGSKKLEGVPFRVVASGYASMLAGTYTATIQPILYGVAGTAAWTAASGNALFSATALTVTVTSATALTSAPWKMEMELSGDSVSGLAGGAGKAILINPTGASLGLPVLTALVAAPSAANKLSSVNFANEPPLQFAIGVTVATSLDLSAAQLDQFYIAAD